MATEEYPAGHPGRLMDDGARWQIGRDLEAQSRGERRSGRGSVYCCPECGGVLWEMGDDGVHFFECHTGHTYSPRLLLRQKTESLESLLFATVRALTEKATLSRQLSATLLGEEDREERARIEALARLDDQHLALIRRVLIEAYPAPSDQAHLVEEALERARG